MNNKTISWCCSQLLERKRATNSANFRGQNPDEVLRFEMSKKKCGTPQLTVDGCTKKKEKGKGKINEIEESHVTASKSETADVASR